MKKITLKIPLHGNPTLTTTGFHGTECHDATKEIEKALGKVVSDKPTPEAYDRPIDESVNQY